MGKKSHNPTVSVIMPVYNGEAFIGAAVESVLAQTFADLELVIVDDGSTDSTLSVLQKYALRDKRVRVIAQENGGVARARNRAIEQARGEFIAPIDADDLWEPTKIQRQVARMEHGGSDIGLVYCWWVWIDEENNILDRSPSWQIEGDAFNRLVQINFTGNASIPLFRKSYLIEVGGYNSSMADAHAGGCEDWELALKVAARCNIAVVPALLVGYRRRRGSMSTACSTMWKSHTLLIQTVRDLNSTVSSAIIRRAQKQFCLYLAGLSFWSGSLKNAVRWGMRAGWRLPIAVAPDVFRMIRKRYSHHGPHHQMKPGVRLTPESVPESPLLSYNQIYDTLGIDW